MQPRFSRALGALVPREKPGLLRESAAVVAAVGAASIVRVALSLFLPVLFPFATYFPAVLLVALYAGARAGVAAVLLSGPIAMLIFSAGAERRLFAAGVLLWLFNGGIVVAVAAAVRALIVEHRAQEAALLQAQARLAMLLREFDHRSRNAFALICAISEETARRSRTIGAYRDALHARIGALARAQSLLLQSTGSPVGLAEVVESALAPFRAPGGGRIAIAPGPPARLEPDAATALTLALHELATNAAKYGALSIPEGRVALGWIALPDGRVEIAWRESSGPPVAPPRAEGFGSTLIRNAFAAAGSTEVVIDYEPEGLCCRMRFSPASAQQDAFAPDPSAAPPS